MTRTTKRQADAHDRIIEAAAALSDLIELSGIEIDEQDLEDLTLYLAHNAPRVAAILKGVKP